MARILVFLLIVVGLTFGLHYYLWVRLVRDASLPLGWARGLTWTLIALGVLLPVAMIVSRVAPRSIGSPVSWVAFTWMGLSFLLFFTLLPMELVRFVGHRTFAVDLDRREALGRMLAGAAGLVGLVMGGAGMVSALGQVALQKVTVSLSRLRKGKSYTLVQLSDVHIGPTLGKEFLQGVVATANAQDADVIVITGDLVDGTVAQLGELVRPLRELRAKHGVFFVTGNHEYYSGADEWLAFLTAMGIRVLRNERVAIDGDDGFDLAGVDDTSSKRFGNGHGQDVAKAMAGRDPSRAVVLLAHQPKAMPDAIAHKVDLQLSGHTHGGQIWPWGYAVRLDQPHVKGLSRDGDTQIYVSRGTGFWGPPMRVGAPAEVTRIEIRGTG